MNCTQCQSPFEVTAEDIKFLKKFDFPAPVECPQCRIRRRWSYRNQSKLYKRKCDFTGEDMVSLYSPDKPYKVYKESVWWSDKWDALQYGKEFDFSRPFFEQFNELILEVPRRGMHQDGTNEKCDYTTFGFSNKNCYLSYACFYCEDVHYSSWLGMAKDSLDCLMCYGNCDHIYECIDSHNCHNSSFLSDCINCTDSLFLDNCRNCDKCICCKNLRNKEYYIYNKKVSKEDFYQYKKDLVIDEEKKKFDKWKLSLPYPENYNQNAENCTGNRIENSKDCYKCFDILLGSENLRYCYFCGWQGKTMMDCTMAGKESEVLYEMNATTNSHKCAFVNFCRGCNEVYYSDCMSSCSYCFGCTGLSHKKYCILNKQYSKEDYEKMFEKIKEHMNMNNEWGMAVPLNYMLFSYNETVAQDMYPLNKEKALELGFKWCDYESESPNFEKIIDAEKLPQRIDDVPDDILKWAIKCKNTGKLFKIISQELAFYRKMNLPLPKCHPEERHRIRTESRLPHKLWNRKCDNCNIDIETAYSPERSEIVYCEKCYLSAVY